MSKKAKNLKTGLKASRAIRRQSAAPENMRRAGLAMQCPICDAKPQLMCSTPAGKPCASMHSARYFGFTEGGNVKRVRVTFERAKAALAKKGPKLKPLAKAFAPLIDAATGKAFGPTRDEARSHRADVLKLKDKLTLAERKELLKLAPRPDDTRWPSEITIGKRFRKAFRNLDKVARSIETLVAAGKPGLLQPIGLQPKTDELIWGERRLRAWRQSAVALTHPIPVRIYDIGAIIVGEYIENDPELRANFTPEEAVDIVRAMTAKQREMAAAADAARPSDTRAAPGRKATPGAASGRVADRAAAITGRSRVTIDKAAAVVDAAADEPEKFGGLLEQMNRTGRVDGPFKRLQVMKQTEAIRSAPPALPGNGPYEVAAFDYPWPHEPDMDQETIDASGRSTRPYPAMAIKEGAHFLREKIAPLLAPKCTVYFWVTGFHMPYAFHLLAALGFTKISVIASWRKDKVGRGRVLRDQNEFCIIAHRGGALIALTDDTTDWSGEGWQTRENSRKPKGFFDLVERKSPTSGRYLMVFSTGGEGERWDGFGDERAKHALAAPAAAADEMAEWKALGAIEGDVAVVGPTFTMLQATGLLAADAGRSNGWALTPEGTDRLHELDMKFKEESAAIVNRKLLAILETIEANPAYQVTLDGELKELIKVGTGAKPKAKLTAKGKKRLAALRAAVEPADRGDEPPPLENENLYNVPRDVIDAITALGGHTFSRTIDYSEGENGFSVATCECGVTFRVDRTLPYSGENEIVPKEEAHWREMLEWKAFSDARPAADPPADPLDIPTFLRRTADAA